MNFKKNPYRPQLEALWGKLSNVNGVLFLIVNQIENYEKQQESLWKKKDIKVPRFMGAVLSITDLTGPTHEGWPYNYPIGGLLVKGHEFAKMKEEIIRRISCFSVAQGYEAFETFLKDTTARYLHRNQGIADVNDVQDFEKQCCRSNKSDVKYWTAFVRFARKTYGGKDNDKLFGFLRKVTPELEVAENKNNRDMDLTKWYKAASVARHAITHSRLEIPEDSWRYLDKNDKIYFPCKNVGHRHFLALERKNAENCLSMFAEYGFLIFKCLSKQDSYKWNIVKGMRTETDLVI